jgi:hypothetical protein
MIEFLPISFFQKSYFYDPATLGSWSFTGRFGEIHEKLAIINLKLIMIHLIRLFLSLSFLQ